MTFTRAEPGFFYRTIRLKSETGRWELGMDDYPSGTRIRMGLNGKPPSVFDFCMGTDPSLFTPILISILKRLQPLPESSSRMEIDQSFPWTGQRPNLHIHLNPLLKSAIDLMGDPFPWTAPSPSC